MKILLDNIIFSLQKTGGVSVYWYEMINRILDESDIKTSFIEEEGFNKNIFRKELKIELNDTIKIRNRLINFLSRYRKINLKMKNENFIFHSTYYRTLSNVVKRRNNIKEIVTVHDFTYEYFSNGLKKWVHSWQKRKAIAAADVVICISENTKKDLLHFLPQFSSKDIRVIYNGVSTDYYKIPQVSSDSINPFFLFVGSRTSYKNFDFAVKAVVSMDNYHLKIVGGELSPKEKQLLDYQLNGRWTHLGIINNNELNACYNAAFALLYPSSYEGFGIPLVEAMKAGCPFIALRCSSITEVAGNAGFLMNTLSIDQFKEGVAFIQTERDEIIEKGMKRSLLYSWDKCYTEVVSVYNELYKELTINKENK
ncbi:glycosyltransferase family 1 protein [Flavobacterium sp. IMCC34518]|uniref:glycosyltransferase family 4 protein n=1 Tax=Flavobacterium sp. IMCC34518 TaxID=3003623 RepID=UPI002482D66C|nr:glycosyltransferase family 1 protein [Flavobacterium sp. IMCC34518]